ncbi:PREDICTED: vacuolar protein sorting-associated protein 8 homolog isoform X1 [Wasmannia auropunctata]|uniref:vacuolar protein sorting-associated protein 8 homolog isoform X1 n=2 Tax=Wasmannia auropunctata TaxID=64793 RepID=UPI0005F0071D|nr:PREDICTED: vacuolar protein sorting-associated protein 8 homolog isoform X1 [Wasmannia auropunctata]
MAENEFVSDSDECLVAEAINLNIEELDNAEYAIPIVEELPTLESILMEPDYESLSETEDDIGVPLGEKLGSSETTSIGSHLSLNSLNKSSKTAQRPSSGVILRHVILKGITSQIVSANERVNAGLASAVAAGGNMLVIGTSHGLILGFDSSQTLRWCDQEARHQGSVSALCFNHDGSRILAGFVRGHILMLDSSNGKVLRILTDVHPLDTAVLHVKFTDSPKIALCSDSGGSVFELNFTRVMGVRGCDSRCLFSGSKGEVCTLEPLLLNHLPSHPLKNYTLVAMATLSKVIVVCIRPRMRVVLSHPLTGAAIAPPQLSWQLVVIQTADGSRVIDPVLALARDNVVYFYQVYTEIGTRIKLSPLRRMTLPYMISNLRWLNPRSLVVLDAHEKLHLLDVRAQDNLETLDMSRVGISYASSHFKGLSTGGNVSKAMALAGERACYNTVVVFGTQLLLLGTKSLHVICMRTWTERLQHLIMQKRYPEALALGLSFYQDKGKAVIGLRGSKQRRKQVARDKVCEVLVQYMDELNQCLVDENIDYDMIVLTCVDYCIQLENIDLLFGKLWDIVFESEGLKTSYLHALEAPLLDGNLQPRLPPLIAQQLVTFYDQQDKVDSLEAIVVLLNVDCLDIHQVTTICRQRGLWEALIYLQTTALGDFTAPIHQLVPVLQNLLQDPTAALSRDCIKLGNAILVYTSCCLAGRGFPKDELPEGMPQKAKADILRALLSQHSSLANDMERQYPYLRTLLQFDAKGFLDVIAIAFQEPEFTSEMGLRHRQRLIDILLSIVMPNTPLTPKNIDYITTEQQFMVLIFVANEVSESTVTLESSTLNKMIDILCIDAHVELSKDFKTERENAVLRLLHSKKLCNISDNTLLNLANRANFIRVAELLYSAREDWVAVCKCMILEPSRHHDVWPWLEHLPAASLDQMISIHTSTLVTINANQFATIVATRLQNKIDAILQSFTDNLSLEYKLLGALYQVAQYKEEDVSLELTTEHLERYLALMCELEPAHVVAHLHGPHGCRLDEALKIVQRWRCKDAEAVMLEKLGNYQDAFDLLLREFEDRLEMYRQDKASESETVHAAIQLAGICRRSAGNLDWMPLIEVMFRSHSENNRQKADVLNGKLLRLILESLSGTSILSNILEQILRNPSATSGTMGDIRQLLSGVLTQSRYEQTLVETTARLVSLELHKALEKSLRDAGRACGNVSITCPVCRQPLSHCSDHVVMFGCGHGYHSMCLGEPKSCYKCLNTKGWAPVATNIAHTVPQPPPRKKQLLPPEFLRHKDLALRLAPSCSIPDLEGIF